MRKFSDELKSIREQSIFEFVNDIKQQMRDAAGKGDKLISIRIENNDYLSAIEEIIKEDEGLSIKTVGSYSTIRWEM